MGFWCVSSGRGCEKDYVDWRKDKKEQGKKEKTKPTKHERTKHKGDGPALKRLGRRRLLHNGYGSATYDTKCIPFDRSDRSIDRSMHSIPRSVHANSPRLIQGSASSGWIDQPLNLTHDVPSPPPLHSRRGAADGGDNRLRRQALRGEVDLLQCGDGWEGAFWEMA